MKVKNYMHTQARLHGFIELHNYLEIFSQCDTVANLCCQVAVTV